MLTLYRSRIINPGQILELKIVSNKGTVTAFQKTGWYIILVMQHCKSTADFVRLVDLLYIWARKKLLYIEIHFFSYSTKPNITKNSILILKMIPKIPIEYGKKINFGIQTVGK